MEDAPTFYVPEKKADTTWGGKNFTEMKTIDELLLDQLEFRVTHPVLQTGFSGLDWREAPLLRWGALTLLTARPAMGKTSLPRYCRHSFYPTIKLIRTFPKPGPQAGPERVSLPDRRRL